MSISSPIHFFTPSFLRPGDEGAPEQGVDMVGEQEVRRRPSGKLGRRWRAAGDVALMILQIAAAVAALYGALKGSGLAE
jgi:hypothetical protein